MAEEIRDIFAGLEEYVRTQFATLEVRTGQMVAVNVKLGLKDERTEQTRAYPEISLILYDITPGKDRRYSGMVRTRVDDIEAGTTELKNTPFPMDLHFQLDTFALSRDHDWAITHKCMQIIEAKHVKITTTNGRVLRMMPQTFDALDNIENNRVWRKAYRFYVPVWFEDIAAAQSAYLVLSRTLNMNDETWLIPAAS